jgi:hypothetical protein
LHEWKVCRGIEIVEALLEEADTLLEEWSSGLPYIPSGKGSTTAYLVPPGASRVEIELFSGDATLFPSSSGGGGGGGGLGGGGGSIVSGSSDWRAPCGPGLSSDPAAQLWTPADFVYACSTCFSEELLEALLRASFRMRKGAFFLTSSTCFEHPAWEVVATTSQPMSWGEATLYLQRRTAWTWTE